MPTTTTLHHASARILYIGDPMCSWCWAFSPALYALKNVAQQQGLDFEIILGGLRQDDGSGWTAEFRQFLRSHWQEIAAKTGQPFHDKIIDCHHFAYNTEPACRAVVTARELLQAAERADETYDFFVHVQKKFYLDNEDPKDVDFYRSICQEMALDVAHFATVFASEKAYQNTAADFHHARQLQVRAFPTVLLQHGKRIDVLSAGYLAPDILRKRFAERLNPS